MRSLASSLSATLLLLQSSRLLEVVSPSLPMYWAVVHLYGVRRAANAFRAVTWSYWLKSCPRFSFLSSNEDVTRRSRVLLPWVNSTPFQGWTHLTFDTTINNYRLSLL